MLQAIEVGKYLLYSAPREDLSPEEIATGQRTMLKSAQVEKIQASWPQPVPSTGTGPSASRPTHDGLVAPAGKITKEIPLAGKSAGHGTLRVARELSNRGQRADSLTWQEEFMALFYCGLSQRDYVS